MPEPDTPVTQLIVPSGILIEIQSEGTEVREDDVLARTDDYIAMMRRKAAGDWLRVQRKTAKMTQKDLAQALDLDYYTFISQIESGSGRVPTSLYRKWALALELDPVQFSRHLVSFYDPALYEALGYSSESDEEGCVDSA